MSHERLSREAGPKLLELANTQARELDFNDTAALTASVMEVTHTRRQAMELRSDPVSVAVNGLRGVIENIRTVMHVGSR